MPLRPWKLRNYWPVWIGLIALTLGACSSPSKKDRVEAFFCAPEPAYTATGAPDVTSYQVKKDCLRGLQKRIAACFKPQ